MSIFFIISAVWFYYICPLVLAFLCMYFIKTVFIADIAPLKAPHFLGILSSKGRGLA